MLDRESTGDAPYATDLLSLDADGVHRLLTDLGYPHYREQLHGAPTFPREAHGRVGQDWG